MSSPTSPPTPPATPLRRLHALVDGGLANLSTGDRARLVAWQEQRTRVALDQLLVLMMIAAAIKVALVVTGVWPTGLAPWEHVLALALLVCAQWAYHRTRLLLLEGLAATVFVAALIVILADPSPGWTRNPALALGWAWLLAALGIPLLARLRSVMIFACVLIVAAIVFVALVPSSEAQRYGIMLYVLISIAGGILLRRLRSDMALEHRRTTESVAASANIDPLTGLANRRGWRDLAPELLANCAQDERAVSLLFIDLDHFKDLNDRQGHAAGDDALQRVGELLQARVNPGLAVRLGGEEFVCLLPGMDADAAAEFASELRDALLLPPDPLTFSGGIARWHPSESIHELLARGDAAMYRAKQTGRDRVLIG